jgi:two-component system, LuxR family, sensor kinase FixL
MTLLKKTLLVLISTVIVSILSIYLASRITLLEGYEKIEQDDARANVLRVVNSYYDQSRSLNLVGRGYAFWDDMYQFVESPDPAFLASLGLTPDLFATHHANLIAILDVNDQPLFLKMYDLETLAPLEIPADLSPFLQSGSPLLAHTAEKPEISGVILLSGSPMYVASLASLRTDFTGAPHGAVIFGRYLDEQVLANLSESSQLDVSASLLDATPMPEDIRQADAWLATTHTEKDVYVQSPNLDTVFGYTYIWTLDKRPGFLLKVAMPRQIYQQGLESFRYFSILAGVSGLIFLLVSIFLLQLFVLSPLTTLNRQISQIRASGDHSQRVVVRGSDELANLGSTINGMLEAIEKHSEERTRVIFDSVNDAIFIHASDGRILDVNETARHMYGYTRQEFGGMDVEALSAGTPPYTQAEAGEWLSQARAGQPQLFEWLAKTKDDHLFWAEVNIRFVQLGQEALFLVTVRDISERKKAEAEREKFVIELEKRNAELERFTYTVSHDLKSPLVTINGFLGYLEIDAKAGNMERLQNDIDRIQEAVNKMRRLLDELLELSRIGRLVNTPEMIPFADLAQDALDTVHGQLQERGVTVIVQPNMPAVFGDRQRLVEVLQNLIDNAAKFMGDEQNPQIEIGQRGEDAEHGKLVFFVKDNGMGIAPKYHEQVFGLFNRLNQDIEGTGIGLALVKRIVEVHGGRIWIESAEGKGSTFYFTLEKGASKT